jgi:hypothetical protein
MVYLSEDLGTSLVINHATPFFALALYFPGPVEEMHIRLLYRWGDREQKGAGSQVTSELCLPKNSEQSMKPILKRYSQEQRLCKEPKQEAIPQH